MFVSKLYPGDTITFTWQWYKEFNWLGIRWFKIKWGPKKKLFTHYVTAPQDVFADKEVFPDNTFKVTVESKLVNNKA